MRANRLSSKTENILRHKMIKEEDNEANRCEDCHKISLKLMDYKGRRLCVKCKRVRRQK